MQGKTTVMNSGKNLRLAVPFLFVDDMDQSLKFYIDGLSFEIKNKWMAAGKIEWCWLERDGVAIMLQEFRKEYRSPAKKGEGVSICIICEDATTLYHEFMEKGLQTAEPFVGNNMWDLGMVDPDGYHLHFESSTGVPEGTRYSEWKVKQA